MTSGWRGWTWAAAILEFCGVSPSSGSRGGNSQKWRARSPSSGWRTRAAPIRKATARRAAGLSRPGPSLSTRVESAQVVQQLRLAQGRVGWARPPLARLTRG
eukprot:11832491-Alexandrium_andersonii.AAC.1